MYALAQTKADLPSRKDLRNALLPFSEKNTGKALRLAVVDYIVFFIGVFLVAFPTHWAVKLIACLVIGIQITRLFLIGHDACHQSLTANRRLNRWVGRLVFLPSLTPFKLWDVGHNMEHHGFTNLAGKDHAWVPFSPFEFSLLSPTRQRLERYYRSGYGHWLYYLLEVWWKRLYFPSKREISLKRSFFIYDCILVSAFALVWIGGLVVVAQTTQQNTVQLVLFGFLLPYLIWNSLISQIIYLHHTDPAIGWHKEGDDWAKSQPYLTTTVHVQVPGIIGAVFHNIMEHPAHHLDMTIPLYQLQAAQRQLDALVPGQILKRRFSWKGYRHCVRTCKLFDYDTREWLAFPGVQSAGSATGRRNEAG